MAVMVPLLAETETLLESCKIDCVVVAGRTQKERDWTFGIEVG